MENGALTNNDAATLALLGNGGYGGHYNNYGNFAHDGSVLNAKLDRNLSQGERAVDRVVDNQNTHFDELRDNQRQAQDFAVETRHADRSANLDRMLYNQFNQIDRRFSAMELRNQECCCELKAGQASILAKLDCENQVRVAVQQAEQGAKIDQILNKKGNT